jgi:hypothetical protein
LKKLTNYNFIISGCRKINEQGITKLATQISKAKTLTKLALHIFGIGISNNYLKQLGGSLSQLSHLTNLWLKFLQSNQVTNEGINDLATNFAQLTNLDELAVELSSSSEEVRKQGQGSIQKAVSGLPHLKEPYIHIN